MRSDAVVLNADNARTAQAAARSKARVYWFSIEHQVGQGAWVEDGYVVYRGVARCGRSRSVMPLSKIPLKGEHNVENVLAAVCAARLAGAPAEAIAPRHRELPGGGASAGVRGHDQWRGLLQRLEGHQCGRDGEGRRRFFRAAFT